MACLVSQAHSETGWREASQAFYLVASLHSHCFPSPGHLGKMRVLSHTSGPIDKDPSRLKIGQSFKIPWAGMPDCITERRVCRTGPHYSSFS